MTQIQQVAGYVAVLPECDDDLAIERVAQKIQARCLAEGEPISWQQAIEDAARAWYEVMQMAEVMR